MAVRYIDCFMELGHIANIKIQICCDPCSWQPADPVHVSILLFYEQLSVYSWNQANKPIYLTLIDKIFIVYRHSPKLIEI